MSDNKKQLQQLFCEGQRYNNFGDALTSIKIQGFRGIQDLTIEINSPITAISGLNGTGKSTIAQLCTCAYKAPKPNKRHIIAKFFPVSKADPHPFSTTASVLYRYTNKTPSNTKDVTVSRQGSRWYGYKRQPERFCKYIGFTVYIPKVEQGDISIYGGTELTIDDEKIIPEIAKHAISKILNYPYENLSSAVASRNNRKTDIGFATKFGAKYSENNMGFGEGRVFYTVSSLENSPDRSLFVIEEPETSLHEHAQHELAKYLIEVCIRKRHQIILTTHSRSILSALHRDSRKLLYREGRSVKISNQASIIEAAGILSVGMKQERTILVEDTRAKLLLREIIRVKKPNLLKGIKIIHVGNDDIVASLTKAFREDKLSVIGIRDGDKGSNSRDHLFKLPGTLPPEQEVFSCKEVQNYLLEKFQIEWGDWKELHTDSDFHEWPDLISNEISKSGDGLWEELCSIYARSIPDSQLDSLIRNIESQ